MSAMRKILFLLLVANFYFISNLSAQNTKELFSLPELTYVYHHDWGIEALFFNEESQLCGKELLVYSHSGELLYVEIDGSKVFKGSDCDNLTLSFDFGLDVDDEIDVLDYASRPITLKVLERQTIRLLDGRDRVFLKLIDVNDNRTYEWIEGIGDTNSGLTNRNGISCVKDGQGSIYLEDEFEEELCEQNVCRFELPSFEIEGVDNTIQLTNATIYADSFHWNFGDGTTSTEVNPTHTYAERGCYIITLESENECGEFRSSVQNYSLCVDSLWTLKQEDFSDSNNFKNISFGSQTVGMAVPESSDKVVSTVDGGLTWQELVTFPTVQQNGHIFKVEMLDENSAIAIGLNEGNKAYITRDGGASWQEHIFQSTAIHREIAFRDEIIVLYFPNNLAISQDGGNTWIEKTIPSEIDLDGLQILESGRLVSTSANRLFNYSDDMGTTWSSVQLNESIPGPTFEIQFISESVGFIGANGSILKTIDGGQTWTETQLPTVSLITDIEFEDDLNGWAVGGHIWRTSDAGESWNIEFCQNKIVGNFAISDIEITDEGAIYTNINGRGVYEHTPEQDFQCNSTSTETLTQASLNIFPNPTSLNISVQTAVDSGTIQIYNSTGVELGTKKFDKPNFDLEVGDYPAGIYYLILNSAEGLSKTVKFVKI